MNLAVYDKPALLQCYVLSKIAQYTISVLKCHKNQLTNAYKDLTESSSLLSGISTFTDHLSSKLGRKQKYEGYMIPIARFLVCL